ncbi:unnamed protein product [Acanthoscelides obtectus]|uniref:Uncharacterized protein n=1 Tax=Acanthoscelides obtectus TaxID=200917 RepID=A0A9P0P2M8_ACAOB|nr:unnamed protein product [Acanthoscelides obtectus]CAK1640343.1 Protein bric-a-brac 2 [Acanthoscelides obtectus]
MGSEHYCLRWNNHQSNLLGVFSQLLRDESLVDVTLACSEGHSIRAHKVVLSACSSYFQSLFVDHPSRHPIVILKDVRFSELRTLVEFMYKGEVNVEYCQLSALLKTAESLKVKGLAEMTREYKPVEEEQTEPKELVNRRPPPPAPAPVPASVLRGRSMSPDDMEEDEEDPLPPRPISQPPSSLPHSPPQNLRVCKSPHTSMDEDSGGGGGPPRQDDDNTPPPPAAHHVQKKSLKKEVDWGGGEDKSPGEGSSDYNRQQDLQQAGAGDTLERGSSPPQSHARLYPCMYCGNSFPHQSKLTRHILSHSLETLKYREQQHRHGLPTLGDPALSATPGAFDFATGGRLKHEPPDPTDQPPTTQLDLEEAAASASSSGLGSSTGTGGVVLCKFCGKSFPDVGSLIGHLPVHTGDRPFKCEFCGKAFKLRHHMKDHCRVHTGERPFRCALCGKTFSRSTILKAHEKTHYPKYVRKFLSPSPLDAEEETPPH